MRTKYVLSVSFYTDRELTEEEAGALQLQVVAQIDEPVTAEGDDVEYRTELYGCDIDKEAQE
jgi:hypothetical protein